jgi:hypothetical protein
MRKLTASEVTFTIELEQDDTPVRGNVMCSDEPELDREAEDEIIARLDNGEIEAWCGVVVTATWEFDGQEYTGTDSLWGNTLSDDYTKEIVAEEHGMKEQALDDLNASLARLYARLSAVAAHLEVVSC